ncbi:MAG: hypothetical protein ACPL7B_01285 [Candidatus Poribacteria bacterium]
MKILSFFLIISLSPILSCNKLQEWDQAFASKQNQTIDQINTQSQQVEPIIEPGEYNLTAPKSNASFILYVPSDYTPTKPFPIIFCYHGAGVQATTWPFYQVSNGNGFIIVGMNYVAPNSPSLELMRYERAYFLEVLNIVSAKLNINQKLVFIGGYSMGGYMTSMLGEQLLDRLAGLIILGAGRWTIERFAPLPKSIRGKPIFIGVGQADTTHQPRAKIAANIYVGWGADVTYEEWLGVGHSINTTEFPSKKLLPWLTNVVNKKYN